MFRMQEIFGRSANKNQLAWLYSKHAWNRFRVDVLQSLVGLTIVNPGSGTCGESCGLIRCLRPPAGRGMQFLSPRFF